MKLTYEQLIESMGNGAGDPGAFARFNRNALPVKISMQMKRIIKDVQAHLDAYNADRKTLLKQYGTLDKDTDTYEFEDAAREQFNAEYASLMATEIEIKGTRLKPSQLLSSTVISPNDAVALEWLLDDGRPTETTAEAASA